MGSAAVATPGCGADAEFPDRAASVAGASGNARRAGAAAPTMAPAPRLRRRFLRESAMAVLLKRTRTVPSTKSLRSYLNALRHEIAKVSRHLREAEMLASGSLNQATLAPPGALQTFSGSCLGRRVRRSRRRRR